MMTFYYYTDELHRTGSIEELESVWRTKKDAKKWLHIYGDNEQEIRRILGEICGFHPSTVDDCLNFNAHPKIEEYDDYIFMVIHSVNYYEKEDRISTRELDGYLGENFLVTYNYKPVECTDLLEKKLGTEKKFITKGEDILYYFLLDKLFDKYFFILEDLDKRIELIDNRIFRNEIKNTGEILNDINNFRRNILIIRKIMIPQILTMKNLICENGKFIREKNLAYYKDILDQLNKVSVMVDVNFDLINGTFQSFTSLLSNKTNEIMKVLTMIATVMMPLTFIAGIYGMNFKHMPELEWEYGYFTVWGIAVLIIIFMLSFFKKKRWL